MVGKEQAVGKEHAVGRVQVVGKEHPVASFIDDTIMLTHMLRVL